MPSRMKVTLLGGAALPTAVVLAHGCRGPTQITLDVRTNVVCAESRGVDIVAASDAHRAEERAALLATGPRFPDATTSDCTEGPAPRKVGTLVITPSGGSGAVVLVTAFGNATLADCVAPKLAPQCIIARRRFSFIEDKQLVMPIVLDPECAGVPCNEFSTCVGKKCVDANVDCSGGTCTEPGVVGADGGLVEVDGSSPLVDSGPSDDGSIATDSGSDGAIDASDAGDGGDGGTVTGLDGGTCGTMTACMQNGSALGMACAGGSAFCCYGPQTTTCGGIGMCPSSSLAACCRDANDCALDEVCCASTPMIQSGTQIFCKKTAECSTGGGRPVCSTNFPECRTTGPCSSTPYTTAPEYFNCS